MYDQKTETDFTGSNSLKRDDNMESLRSDQAKTNSLLRQPRSHGYSNKELSFVMF